MRSLSHLALAGSAAAQVFDTSFAFHPRNIDHQPLPYLSKRLQYEPCAEVSELWTAQKAQLSKPGAIPSSIRVPAKRAYDCLLSVPVDIEGDIKEIQELKAYLEYQSTLAWLKSGVKDQIDPLDIMGGLDTIAKGVKNKGFKNDYDVQLSIRRLLDGEF
jgi:hypothetical protein